MKLKKLMFNRILIIGLLFAVQLTWFGVFLVHLTTESWWIHMLMRALSVIALLVIINRNENPAYKLAWTVPILTFPLLGGMMYVFFGGKKPARGMRKKLDASAKETASLLLQNPNVFEEIKTYDQQIAGQVNYIKECGNFPVYGQTQTK